MTDIKWKVTIGRGHEWMWGVKGGHVTELARVVSRAVNDDVVVYGDDVVRAVYRNDVPNVDIAAHQYSNDIETQRQWRSAWPAGIMTLKDIEAGHLWFSIEVKPVEPFCGQVWVIEYGDVLKLAQLVSAGFKHLIWVVANARMRAEYLCGDLKREFQDLRHWYVEENPQILEQWQKAHPKIVE